jgi:RNA polymerase sigma-70 factor (sigma-E family)
MYGRLRVDVAERDRESVFGNDVCGYVAGDDAAEQARVVGHLEPPGERMARSCKPANRVARVRVMATVSGLATMRSRSAMVPVERWDADDAVTELYAAHYRALVRLAALLVRHSGEAEEIVQDAFVAMHAKWRRLRDPHQALGYLRQTVVNRARSSQRRHAVADRHSNATADDYRRIAPSAEQQAMSSDTRARVMDALDRLPTRQREVLILRYYSDLSERDIAATLGISQGAVKSHASRGVAALRTTLEDIR